MPSVSEHRGGHILRIKLKNFMTYDKLELETGPGLNMIIGPNGSGKSSIICAICLGLAGKPVFTGRQLRISEYIKHGCQHACIQIVLADPSSQTGCLKIRRKISQTGPSEYRINSNVAKESQVEKEVSRFNIQVNNLCQFLPQEKVSEFAKMSPKQLLESMQQTVADPVMHRIYEDLIQFRSEALKYEADINDRKSSLENVKTKSERLKPALLSYRNRQEIKEQIRRLEEKRELLVYMDLLTKSKALSEELDSLKKKLKNFKENHVDALNKQLEDVNKEIQSLDGQIRSLNANTRKNNASIESSLREIKDADNKISELKLALRDKCEEYKRLGTRKEDARLQIAAFENNLQRHQQRQKTLEDEVKANLDQSLQNMRNLANVEQEISEKGDNIQSCGFEEKKLKQELGRLDDLENRKLELLKRTDKDTYEAMCWLEKNAHVFKKKIIGPLMLLINVPDSRNMKFLETHIAKRDMTLFLCEDTEDTKMFTNILRNKQNLSVNTACVATTKPLNSYKPSRPEGLTKYRFVCFLKDLFDAPDVVKAYLCERYNIHNTPIGNEATDDLLLRRGSSIIPEIPFNRFYTSSTSYTIRRSRYGDRNISCNTSLIRDMGYLSSFASSSENERKALEQKSVVLGRQKQQLIDEKNALLELQKTLVELVEKDRRKKQELINITEILKQCKQQIEQKKRDLVNLDAEFQEFDLKAMQQKCAEKTVSLKDNKIVQFQNLLEYNKALFKDIQSKCSLHFYKASCTRERQVIEMNIEVKNSEQTDIEKEVEEKYMELAATRTETKKQRDKASEKTGLDLKTENGRKQSKSKYEDLPNQLHAVDKLKMKYSSQMECMLETDEVVIEEHQKLEHQIQKDEKYLETASKKLVDLNKEISKKKQLWLNPLQALISKVSARFSSYFESMGCAGEVSLSTGENEDDFDKYGLSIQVKYRDTVPLRELSQAHHSGGECSVATMIFILSLQELVEVPFRCVDEINQGMDSINERKIFEFVAKSAENSAQYFLLTPKLLHDLPYPEKMSVHVIHNGPCLEFLDWNDWNDNTLLEEEECD